MSWSRSGARCTSDLGVVFPGIQLRYNDQLPTEVYAHLVAEIPVSQGRLRPGYLLVRETTDNLAALAHSSSRPTEVPAEHADDLGAGPLEGSAGARRHFLPRVDPEC